MPEPLRTFVFVFWTLIGIWAFCYACYRFSMWIGGTKPEDFEDHDTRRRK